jgi:hypothetical protein
VPGVSVRLSLARWVPLPADSLLPFVQSAVSVDASVHTDGWKGYDRLSRLGYDHRPRWQTTAPKGEQLLPRAHRAWQLPVYLDEYVFRHNRRANPHAAFQTVLGSAPITSQAATGRSSITRPKAQLKRSGMQSRDLGK